MFLKSLDSSMKNILKKKKQKQLEREGERQEENQPKTWRKGKERKGINENTVVSKKEAEDGETQVLRILFLNLSAIQSHLQSLENYQSV